MTYDQAIMNVSMLNAGLALIVSIGAGFIVLSHKIDDGIVPKIGLCILSLSQFATAVMLADGSVDNDAIGLLRAQTCTRVGMIVIGLGIIWHHSEIRQRARVFFRINSAKTTNL